MRRPPKPEIAGSNPAGCAINSNRLLPVLIYVASTRGLNLRQLSRFWKFYAPKSLRLPRRHLCRVNPAGCAIRFRLRYSEIGFVENIYFQNYQFTSLKCPADKGISTACWWCGWCSNCSTICACSRFCTVPIEDRKSVV